MLCAVSGNGWLSVGCGMISITMGGDSVVLCRRKGSKVEFWMLDTPPIIQKFVEFSRRARLREINFIPAVHSSLVNELYRSVGLSTFIWFPSGSELIQRCRPRRTCPVLSVWLIYHEARERWEIRDNFF